MKKYGKFLVLIICISLTSCKSIVSNPGKPLLESSIQMGKIYEIQDFNAKIYNIKIIRIDGEHIYGTYCKDKKPIILERSSIRQMKEWQVLNSVFVGAIAIAAVIFIPI